MLPLYWPAGLCFSKLPVRQVIWGPWSNYRRSFSKLPVRQVMEEIIHLYVIELSKLPVRQVMARG